MNLKLVMLTPAGVHNIVWHERYKQKNSMQKMIERAKKHVLKNSIPVRIIQVYDKSTNQLIHSEKC